LIVSSVVLTQYADRRTHEQTPDLSLGIGPTLPVLCVALKLFLYSISANLEKQQAGRRSLWDRGDMSPNIYEGGRPSFIIFGR